MKIGFIGLGLIGGSIAKGIKKAHPEYTLAAYSRTRSKLEMAKHERIIDEIYDQVDERIGSCDLIILCTPVSFNEMYLEKLKPHLSPNALISDVGSTKHSIHEDVERLGLGAQFVGGHPMAGSEKTGYENATDHLLQNAFYIITPASHTTFSQINIMKNIAEMLGAIPIVLDPSMHDEAVAAISHVPHLIACALVQLVKNNDSKDQIMKQLAAGGFKDITRIASSSPEMWEQICMTNQSAISEYLSRYIDSLSEIRKDVLSGNGKAIYDLFDSSREYRNSFAERFSGAIEKQYYLYCDIVDRSGAIAEIAVMLATRSINIKNIGIINNRNFEAGVLRIEFYDEKSLTEAKNVLKTYGFLAE